jgi:hypothetical protein
LFKRAEFCALLCGIPGPRKSQATPVPGGLRARLARGPEAAPPALAAYLVLSIVLLSRALLGGGAGQHLVGNGGDPLGFVWFLAWLPHALTTGNSPFFSNVLMAPAGANLLASTSITLPALLLWPVTALFGPVTSLDVLATAGLTASAAAMYIALLRLVTTRRSSAWLGGLLYGFGGYMTGQASAHVNLMIIVFPPLAAILLDQVRRAKSPVRTGVLLGLCAAAQVFVDEEVLALTAVMALVAAMIAASVRPSRDLVLRFVRALGAGAVVFVVIAGPALAYQFVGPEHVSGVIVTSGRYVNDLEGFVVPNTLALFSTGGARHLAATFSGYDGESGSYLGIPLIALLVWACWRLRRRALPAGVLLVTAAVFSLGPHLHIGGHDTGIYLPWIVPNHLPVLENVVPDRFNLFIWFAVAVLVVQLLDDLRSRPVRGARALGPAVCCLALIPALPTLVASETPHVPRVLANRAAFRVLPSAATVLITPSGNGQLAMYAQAKSGFAYKIPDGGVFVPGRDGVSYGMRDGPLLYALAAVGGEVSTESGRTAVDRVCLHELAPAILLSKGCRAYYVRALRAEAITAVVVADVGPAWQTARYRRFIGALLGPGSAVAGARVYRLDTEAHRFHRRPRLSADK